MQTTPFLTNAGSTRDRPSIAVVDLKTQERHLVELEIGEKLYLRSPAGAIECFERRQLLPDRWQIIEASPLAGAA